MCVCVCVCARICACVYQISSLKQNGTQGLFLSGV